MSQKIRTTHVGNLPRPEALVPFLRTRHQDQPIDEATSTCARPLGLTEMCARRKAKRALSAGPAVIRRRRWSSSHD
jgi:hypothetical protein